MGSSALERLARLRQQIAVSSSARGGDALVEHATSLLLPYFTRASLLLPHTSEAHAAGGGSSTSASSGGDGGGGGGGGGEGEEDDEGGGGTDGVCGALLLSGHACSRSVNALCSTAAAAFEQCGDDAGAEVVARVRCCAKHLEVFDESW